uniref:Endonuclease/exonuclease/phosphatase domain-containing protein n=1 Tax=Macaca fascicularis TaxID=9541 RepID=A0A7N9DC27_MACFA
MQILLDLKRETDHKTIISWDFNSTLSGLDRSSRQKINKETSDQTLICTTDHMDIYRPFHLIAAEYIFFSSAHRIFSKTDHSLGHKTCLKNSKQFKSYQVSSISSDHNRIKLEISSKRNFENYRNSWKCFLNHFGQ